MIQSTNETIQVLATNTSDITFTNDELRTRSATCSGWLNHTEGTSQYTILGNGNCCQPAVYEITFNANVTGATAGPIEIGLKENGTVNIHVDLKKNYPQHIGGTPINDEMNALITEEKQNTSDQTLFNQNIYKIVNGIVEKHPRP